MRSLLFAVAAAVTASSARAAGWEALPPAGRIVVHVYKKGLFSAFAHDHHFEATKWRVTAHVPEGDPASTSIALVVDADSLRDRQPSLSDDDRRKVDAQAAGPDVLDAQHHPRIEFASRRFELESGAPPGHVRGKLHGTLTIRGRSAPADVTVDAERKANEWRVRANARLKQTAFGIKPFSGFAGTVGVKDEFAVEIALILRPTGGANGAPASPR